eukprot:1852880-Prymnesium_polylepis.2
MVEGRRQRAAQTAVLPKHTLHSEAAFRPRNIGLASKPADRHRMRQQCGNSLCKGGGRHERRQAAHQARPAPLPACDELLWVAGSTVELSPWLGKQSQLGGAARPVACDVERLLGVEPGHVKVKLDCRAATADRWERLLLQELLDQVLTNHASSRRRRLELTPCFKRIVDDNAGLEGRLANAREYSSPALSSSTARD